MSALAAVWGERPATSASRAVRRWSPGMDRTTMTLAGLMVLAWRSVIVFGPVGWLFRLCLGALSLCETVARERVGPDRS